HSGRCAPSAPGAFSTITARTRSAAVPACRFRRIRTLACRPSAGCSRAWCCTGDSLGSRQLIRPGELNLMTAGGGIAHSEESAAGRPPVLHGLQLWIALPEAERHGEPRFAHHADLPVVRDGAANVTVARSDAGPGRMPGHSPGPFGPGDLTGRGSAGLPPGPAGWGW